MTTPSPIRSVAVFVGCSACDGTGRVYAFESSSHQSPCETCTGTGEVIAGSAILAILLAACTPTHAEIYQVLETPTPSIRFYRLAYVEVAPEHVDLWQADSLYVTSGIVVLNGPRIHSRITAPNTYRDPDGRCYSGNVLHVSGERIAVECP